MTQPADAPAVDGTQSIKRVIAVLRAVAASGEPGASLRDVTTATRLHRATAYRMLRALVAERMVECTAGAARYRLGFELFALGAAMGDRFDIKSLAALAVERLCAETGDIVYLVVRSGYDGLCLTMREGSHPEKTPRLMEGDRWPLGVGTNNLAILAYLPDCEIAEIIAHNRPRLEGVAECSPERTLREVAATRRRGFAMRARRDYPPTCGVGVPILDRDRRPIASLGVVAVQARMSAERQERIAELLWREARELGAQWAGLSTPKRENAMPAGTVGLLARA
jgi:DNA-binding IclR family transcriptional regulator